MQVLPMLALVFLLPLPAAPAQQGERYALEGDDIAIYNLAGELTLEPGIGSVTVELTRGGADSAKLRVERGELYGRETLRVVYPGARSVVYPGQGRDGSTTLLVREDGSFGDGLDPDHGHAGRKVRIAGEGSGLRAHADLRIRVPPAQRLEVYLAVGTISITNVHGDLHVDGHSAPITTTGTRGSLTLDVGSGPVRVRDAEGTLSVDTGSGPVEVSGFRGGELRIDSGSGQVTGSDLQAREIRIDTGSGAIELTAVSTPVLSLDTGSGNVTADLQGLLRELSVQTGSGNVAVAAPASLAAEVDIQTASGGIETDFTLQVTRHSPDHVVGQIGDGQGSVAIETGSGDVRLLKNPK